MAATNNKDTPASMDTNNGHLPPPADQQGLSEVFKRLDMFENRFDKLEESLKSTIGKMNSVEETISTWQTKFSEMQCSIEYTTGTAADAMKLVEKLTMT